VTRPTVSLIEGDGIGPEIAAATVRAIEAAGGDIEWERVPAGAAAVKSHGDPLPQITIDSLKKNLIALKSPLGNVPAFRKKIQGLLGDEEGRAKLMSELGLGDKGGT